MSHWRAAALIVLAITPRCAWAWGDAGHAMSGRVAVRALPAEAPAFFREAVEEVGYLCSQPDRWRDRKLAPGLVANTSPDHYMNLEDVPAALPATRHEFLRANAAQKTAAQLGTAAYAIAEYAEMLAVEFSLWRQAPEGRIRRQIEQNVIHTAGVLCHWVTDTAQPLHATIHTNGWRDDYPNPRGFQGKGIHSRFETEYVAANITEADIAPRVAPVREVGPWLEAAERHLRTSHKLVENVYEFDQQAPFGSGQQPAEVKAFAAERLAVGVAMLRDIWVSAWKRSQ